MFLAQSVYIQNIPEFRIKADFSSLKKCFKEEYYCILHA